MAKRKTTSKYSGILRPLSQDELDRKRVHFAAFDRRELEDLLIRAAHKIENLEGRLAELEAKNREYLVNKRRATDAIWGKDERTCIKTLVEKVFAADWAARIHERGARASFIKSMSEAHHEIKDPKTFGVWWDVWKKALAKELASSQGTPLDAEDIRRWMEWRESLARLPAILKLLGHVPKLPSWK